jgi:hypothetical protein
VASNYVASVVNWSFLKEHDNIVLKNPENSVENLNVRCLHRPYTYHNCGGGVSMEPARGGCCSERRTGVAKVEC